MKSDQLMFTRQNRIPLWLHPRSMFDSLAENTPLPTALNTSHPQL